MTNSYENKLGLLKRRLQELESAVVAFSGGVDSSVLVFLAHEVLGKKMIAVTAVSPSFPKEDRNVSKLFCKKYSIPHRFIETNEFSDPTFISNPFDRCYHCKRHLYKDLTTLACELGFSFVLEGTNASDLGGHRPGFKASSENPKVATPLIDVEFTKDDVRRLARDLNLQAADKPSSACLASRVPTGMSLNPALMKKIDEAEELIRGLGVKQVRVRHHGEIARIEVEETDFIKTLECCGQIHKQLVALGWKFVTLDFAGYRTGGMRG